MPSFPERGFFVGSLELWNFGTLVCANRSLGMDRCMAWHGAGAGDEGGVMDYFVGWLGGGGEREGATYTE